jgi:Enoyl-CoA hydratase/isomerase
MNVPPQLLQAREAVLAQQLTPSLQYRFSEQLSARFDTTQNAMWSHWSAIPRPCFNPGLLRDLRSYYDMLAQTGGKVSDGIDEHPIEYVVLASAMPGVFNLGGDLDLFRSLIDKRDRPGLSMYGRACVDVLHRNYIAHGLPATTISLVQGECLGGGFEAALSSDVIIAERSARFGFPEILFNLFPGMGAPSSIGVLARSAERRYSPAAESTAPSRCRSSVSSIAWWTTARANPRSERSSSNAPACATDSMESPRHGGACRRSISPNWWTSSKFG